MLNDADEPAPQERTPNGSDTGMELWQIGYLATDAVSIDPVHLGNHADTNDTEDVTHSRSPSSRESSFHSPLLVPADQVDDWPMCPRRSMATADCPKPPFGFQSTTS